MERRYEMKVVLLIIAFTIMLGILASAFVLVSMGIDSRKLWEIQNLMEKENKEQLKGGSNEL